MHVGLGVLFEGIPERSDRDSWMSGLEFADAAERRGYESIWCAEHHFSDYLTSPNVLQFLTYMAGRTENVKLGSQCVILPWHDPVRVAEEISVLDTVSGGRAILGFGRGLGQIEFNGFRLKMGESRRRFGEYADAIINAFDSGFMEYNGELYKQPRVDIRPRPMAPLRGRAYAAAVSPESIKLMARLGMGLLIIPQKPWKVLIEELSQFRAMYNEAQGEDPIPPVYINFVACHQDRSVAEEIRLKYMRRYGMSAISHYDFANADLGRHEGYEYYSKMADRLKRDGIGSFAKFVADLMVCGTPDDCYQQIMDHLGATAANAFIAQFNFGGIPQELAMEGFNLFADKVMPRLKLAPGHGRVGLATAA